MQSRNRNPLHPMASRRVPSSGALPLVVHPCKCHGVRMKDSRPYLPARIDRAGRVHASHPDPSRESGCLSILPALPRTPGARSPVPPDRTRAVQSPLGKKNTRRPFRAYDSYPQVGVGCVSNAGLSGLEDHPQHGSPKSSPFGPPATPRRYVARSADRRHRPSGRISRSCKYDESSTREQCRSRS